MKIFPRLSPAALSAPLLLAGCGELTGTEDEKAAAAAAATPTASPESVVVGPPVRKSLSLSTVQPGRIDPIEDAPLFAKVSGYIAELAVDIGDRVERGQVLVRLSVPELEDDRRQKAAFVDQAKAEVGQAKAASKAATAARASAEAGVAQAKASIERAEAEYARWQAESGRLDALAETGSVTRKVADETRNQSRAADAARREAAAAVRSAEAAVAEAVAGIEKAEADVAAAEARLAVAEAGLRQAETMLAYTEIKAPFAGVVTQRNVHPGHFVINGTGASPLVAVARTDRVRVSLDVPEVEAAQVDVGDAAAIRVQALPGADATGAVTRTGWSLEPGNRTLRPEIELDNADGRLRPGMYATAEMTLATRSGALTLPIAAVAQSPAGPFCFVVRDDKAVKTPVKLGLRVGSDWEVVEGLSGTETVSLTKASTLTDGQAVAPAEPAKP